LISWINEDEIIKQESLESKTVGKENYYETSYVMEEIPSTLREVGTETHSEGFTKKSAVIFCYYLISKVS
jgi:hypothetical protein